MSLLASPSWGSLSLGGVLGTRAYTFSHGDSQATWVQVLIPTLKSEKRVRRPLRDRNPPFCTLHSLHPGAHKAHFKQSGPRDAIAISTRLRRSRANIISFALLPGGPAPFSYSLPQLQDNNTKSPWSFSLFNTFLPPRAN